MPGFKQHVAPWLVFPIIMSAGLCSTQALIALGQSPVAAALISVLVFGFAVIPLLERLIPYRQEWNKNHSDLGPDLIYMVSNVLIPKLWTPVQVLVLASITIELTERWGSSLWPDSLHWLPGLFLMLLIAEFGRYWVHRAAHQLWWLWRLHAVHHSSERLYFLNANRFHPLEKLLFQIPEVAPFVLLGTPVEIIAMYFTFNSLHGFMQHGNVHIKAGWLNYIFSMTELHRWHHSELLEESDRNFGNNLIIWDILFGTFYYPKGREVGVVGLLSKDYPQRWWQQMKAPFSRADLSKPAGYLRREPENASTENGQYE